MQWIDTHCHLDAREFDADRLAVVARANAAGVTMQVIPAVGVFNFETVRALAHEHGLAYALGIHPLCVGDAARRREQRRAPQPLTRWTRPLRHGMACSGVRICSVTCYTNTVKRAVAV